MINGLPILDFKVIIKNSVKNHSSVILKITICNWNVFSLKCQLQVYLYATNIVIIFENMKMFFHANIQS